MRTQGQHKVWLPVAVFVRKIANRANLMRLLGEAAQIEKVGVQLQTVTGAFGEPFSGCLTRNNTGEKQVIVGIQHEDALFSFLRVGGLSFT